MEASALLVGSVGLADAEAVFRQAGASIGPWLQRVPDGETGKRHYWLLWQEEVFSRHPDFAGTDPGMELVEGRQAPPQFALDPAIDAASFDMGPLGYAEEAIASWRLFERLRGEGVVPAGLRFQVSLPTPLAMCFTFTPPEQMLRLEPVIERAFEGEIARMLEAIPATELAIQWDVAWEVIGLAGGAPMPFGDAMNAVVERLVRLVGRIPAGVEAGVHLCYGDAGHKHFIEPVDLGLCVALANAVTAGADRPVQWVHMPVPRDRDDDAYFAPLAGLAIPDVTELYLGLVHYTDAVEGTRRRIAAADRHRGRYGIATECGFGRRDPATIPALLDIHAELLRAT